ncbi:MAG TPA: hypothetical protein VLB85_03805 [Acidimicrobiia bacterium]|nr:hypothetical protein [Acidimicrobiia bacterium]
MRRLMVLFVILAVAGALPASAKPEVFPPEYWEDAFQFGAGFPCEFPVDVELSGKEGAIIFEDRAILTAPGFRVRLAANGIDLDLSIAGTFHERYEGSLAIGKATGRNVLFGFFGGVPGMFLTVGRVDYIVDNDTLEWTILNSHKMIDLCEVLAG